MAAAAGLTYREGPPDTQHHKALHRLLLDIFDVDISPVDEFGLADPTYRAFSYLDETGCCVANAATFTLKLIINGKVVNAVGIQSVATRPAWRRRGLSQYLLKRALLSCNTGMQLTFLMTGIPGFYEPMGFRIVPQFAHIGSVAAVPSFTGSCRRLSLEATEDRRLLVQVLRNRVPVSMRFAVDAAPGAFILNLFDRAELSAWYIEPKQAVVVTATQSNGTLCVVDVAAVDMPSLEEIVAALGNPPGQVEVHFPPDRLAWNGTPTPTRASTVLMVSGDMEPVEPFMIPATASF